MGANTSSNYYKSNQKAVIMSKYQKVIHEETIEKGVSSNGKPYEIKYTVTQDTTWWSRNYWWVILLIIALVAFWRSGISIEVMPIEEAEKKYGKLK